MSKVKKITLLFILILTVILAVTWYYSKPFYKKMGNRGFVMIYYTRNRPQFKSIEYVIITEVDKHLVVEVIVGPGHENVIKIEGKDAKNFLDRMDLDY